ncbi:MAG TPA: hypothetical protein VK841_04810 [Polyangiaceae bacterium]|jgi:hypothetical protein|nr:hypothetical protein [Polyangiaceae bacterium]
MNINSLFGSVGTTATSNVNPVTTTSTTSASSIPPSAAASAAISTPGQFFSQMQSLSQSNPTEFKAVASQVATTFQNAASQATGQQAQFLTNLANQFSQAAQTGTMPNPATGGVSGASAAQAASPQGAPHMHHHHHHGGGGGGGGAVSQAFQSAMETLTQATSTTASTSTSAFSSTSTSSDGAT